MIGLNLQGQLESQPMLATSWRRIDDSTLEVSLRQGVRFHNGDEMTAEDIAFTFGPEHMFGTTTPAGMDKTLLSSDAHPIDSGKALPPQAPPIARRLWPSLVKVEVVDRYTARFVNATPDVTLEGRLTQLGSEIGSRRAFQEAKTWLDWARGPVGTGPYRVRSYTPNRELVLEAFDDYWGGRPPIATIRFVEVPEVAERVNGLRAGDFQFACDLPPDQIKTVEADPKLQVVGGLIPNHRITVFDKYDTALRDARVRQAMCHAIDRKQIVDSLWLGRTRRSRRPAMGVLRPDVRAGMDRAGIRPGEGARPAEAGRLQGRPDPLPAAQRLLHEPDRDRAGPGGDVVAGRAQRADRA